MLTKYNARYFVFSIIMESRRYTESVVELMVSFSINYCIHCNISHKPLLSFDVINIIYVGKGNLLIYFEALHQTKRSPLQTMQS
jgi:hypothetical protein